MFKVQTCPVGLHIDQFKEKISSIFSSFSCPLGILECYPLVFICQSISCFSSFVELQSFAIARLSRSLFSDELSKGSWNFFIYFSELTTINTCAPFLLFYLDIVMQIHFQFGLFIPVSQNLFLISFLEIWKIIVSFTNYICTKNSSTKWLYSMILKLTIHIWFFSLILKIYKSRGALNINKIR